MPDLCAQDRPAPWISCILTTTIWLQEAARAAALDQVTDDQLEAAVMSGITKSRARQDAPGLNNGGGNGQDEDLQRPVIDVESSDRCAHELLWRLLWMW